MTSAGRKSVSWRPYPWSGTGYDNKYCQNPDWRSASFVGWPDLFECRRNPLQQPVEKGEVATKSRRRISNETAFTSYVNPTKFCNAALSWGVSTSLRKCVVGEASQVRGTVRFMSRKLTSVAVACRIHDNTDGSTLFFLFIQVENFFGKYK